MSGDHGRRAFITALVMAGCAVLLTIGQLHSPAATAAPGSRAAARILQPYPDGVYLNEFMPDPVADWNGNGQTGDEDDEYIEIYNSNDFELDLSGWQLDDIAGNNTGPFILPVGSVIPEHSFLVFFSNQTRLVLNNSSPGDSVRLLRPDGSVADETSYTATQPDRAHSRTSDGAGVWVTTYPPSPGQPNQPLPPTSTPTATATATAGPTATPFPDGITLNEFMPDPVADWNGNGQTGDEDDEYIELYNSNDYELDVSGWQLDDIAGNNTGPFTLPAGSVIPEHSFLVFFSNQTRLVLNNSSPGDSVRLLRPDGSVADETSYTATQPDRAHSRTIDGAGVWVTTYPPSPGQPNQPLPPTSTPTATATPTTGPSATPFPGGITLNEFMPDPVADWNGNGQTGDEDDEYIELYNSNDYELDVSGWQLDDVATTPSSDPFTLPAGSVIPEHSFLVFFSNQTRLVLNNSSPGDSVRLLRPDGSVADETSYTATQPDRAHSRTIDGAGVWVTTYLPSPGASNQPPPTNTVTVTRTPTASRTATATPTAIGTPTATATPAPAVDAVSLNEFMPDPVTDWNGNGQTGDSDDEYIELYNGHDSAVDLSGWKLDDAASAGSSPFTLPAGSTIPANGFLVFFSNQTHLALNNSGGDSVRLLRPDGSEVESFAYTANFPDQAYSKTSDGGASWTTTYPPSPGSANLPGPTATPSATGALAGHVFGDADADGVYEPWLGEQGLADVLVILDDARSYLTNASGWYGFFNLAPGQHTVRHAQPVHMTSTTANEYTVIVEPGSTVDELNFGQIPLPPGQIQSPVVLNEFLPSPASDWDGNGVADADDEWIELTNPGVAPVDVSGWWLDDEAESLLRAPDGSAPYMLPIGSVIPASGFLVVFRSTSGIALNNSGDDVRLIGPASYDVETFAFGSTAYDISWSKTADGGDQWINSYPPSPGAGNQPGSATATPSVTSTASATATPTPAGTPTPLPDGISLNEYLPDPASDWDGNGVIDAEDEYVEIYNANSFAVDLTDWMLDDLAGGGSQPYHFPAGTSLPGQGFLVVYRSHSSVALNNDGDHVRLLGPDGSVIEETDYDTSDDDLAYSKLVEGSSLWTDVYPPSPGLPNLPGTNRDADTVAHRIALANDNTNNDTAARSRLCAAQRVHARPGQRLERRRYARRG